MSGFFRAFKGLHDYLGKSYNACREYLRCNNLHDVAVTLALVHQIANPWLEFWGNCMLMFASTRSACPSSTRCWGHEQAETGGKWLSSDVYVNEHKLKSNESSEDPCLT